MDEGGQIIREKLFEYVANQYGINPDYPFSTAPTYALLDGSVDFDELCQWIDTSYSATN